MIGYDALHVGSDAGPLTAQIGVGCGPLVVFQHGLCGDAAQPAEVFPGDKGFRHAVLNCRGHGGSPLGPVKDLLIATFADDVARMITALPTPPVAVGGISMGAAIALRLAVRRPDLVPALILSRPAWVTESAPANMQPNTLVGQMLVQGLAAFDATEIARDLAEVAPDNLASLRGFFARQPLSDTAALLTRISADGPGVTEAELAALRLPVLVLGTEQDHVHPMAHAVRLAGLIPGAVLIEIPPKGQNRAAHVAAMQSAILGFLKGLTDAPPQH
jgi:pimeloyl-ACP methyl ester carboxylesterase